jgi:hypothetical protein
VCLMDQEMGQFECMAAAAAAAAGSGSQVSSSTGSVCAPLVRSTVQGRRCVLPFTWQGAPRDDCIWRHGMSVCPVAASTAEAAAAAAGGSSSNRRADSAGDYYRHNPAGNPAADDATAGLQDLLVSPTGSSPWVWQQCARDYETRWEQPPDDAPGRRWVLGMWFHVTWAVCCVYCRRSGSSVHVVMRHAGSSPQTTHPAAGGCVASCYL